MKKHILCVSLIFAFVTGLVLTATAQIRTGGYKSVATDDARVVAAAEFAVSKREETHTEQEGLTLDSIDKAETQVVAGTNFRLCLTVKLEDETQQVQVVVFQNLKQVYSLTSWTVKDCAEKVSASTGDHPALQSSSPFPAGKVAIARCSGDKLSFKETEGEGDIGGKSYAKFLFTNISSSPCTLRLSECCFA